MEEIKVKSLKSNRLLIMILLILLVLNHLLAQGYFNRLPPYQLNYNANQENQLHRVPFSFARRSSVFIESEASAQTTLLGKVNIGNPSQTLDILFDTGSSLFWVIDGQNCEAEVAGVKGDCPGFNKFDRAKSKTFTPSMGESTTYAYGSGTIPNTALNCTIIGTDDLYLAGTPVFQQHPICAVDRIKLANSYAADLPYDGIMGLAPLPNDQRAIVNVRSTMIQNFRIVSFWYDRKFLLNLNNNGQYAFQNNGSSVGVIIFGDDSHYTSLYNNLIASIPIVINRVPASWTILVNSISIDSDTPMTVTGGLVLVDTGAGGADLPEDIWNSLYQKLAPKQDNEGNMLVDCRKISSIPNISFSISGQNQALILTGAQQVLPKQNCQCALIFSPATGNQFLWGSIFLANFYTTFDYTDLVINFFETEHQKPWNC